ncbi:MAG: EboA domain-containing protein [Halomonas sp.]|nr:EboA domain-containing protein [Halomonas sp.]
MSGQAIELLRCWVIRQSKEQGGWFSERLEALANGAPERELHIVMGLAPRRLGKADLVLTQEDLVEADAARPGWYPVGWSVEGAARVAALLAHHGERTFAEKFKDLRRTADVSELIALYRGLPLYPAPQSLAFEAEEGLRSNMRAVFEAIAHHNPYPHDHFDEHRFNHMVLKALFVGSRLAPIRGLDARANPELARMLLDYAHERWSAGRTVSPELWRCVGPFAAEVGALTDLQRVLNGSSAEQAAAALALSSSPSAEAREILATAPVMADLVGKGRISWDTLPTSEAA